MFMELIAFTGAQNKSTVTTANGTAARRINGMRRPLGFLDLSESEPLSEEQTLDLVETY